MIRRATSADAEVVGNLLYRFNSEYEDRTPAAELLASHYRELLAAEEVTVLLSGEEPYVVPGRRGHGIGRALLEATIEAAREAGATHVELTTGEEDVEARSLYESAGFTNREGRPDGPRMLYYEREL